MEKKTKKVYLMSSFSLQSLSEILDEGVVTIKVEVVDKFPKGLTSAVGHKDTAEILGVEMNRIDTKLKRGEIAYVAQYMGGRLPEGCINLPENPKFKFLKITIE